MDAPSCRWCKLDICRSTGGDRSQLIDQPPKRSVSIVEPAMRRFAFYRGVQLAVATTYLGEEGSTFEPCKSLVLTCAVRRVDKGPQSRRPAVPAWQGTDERFQRAVGAPLLHYACLRGAMSRHVVGLHAESPSIGASHTRGACRSAVCDRCGLAVVTTAGAVQPLRTGCCCWFAVTALPQRTCFPLATQ